MNRALYYSLMESRHLMRDTILMEDWEGKSQKSLRFVAGPSGSRAVDRGSIRDAIFKDGHKPTGEEKFDPSKLTSEGGAAYEDVMRGVRRSGGGIKADGKTPRRQGEIGRTRAYAKAVGTDPKGAAPVKPTKGNPKGLSPNARRTSNIFKKAKWYDPLHPNHPLYKGVQKVSGAVSGARKELGAEYEHIRRGGLKAGLKTGVKIGAPLLAGMAIGARRIGKEVQSMPAYQHAKQYGDTIEKVKKYGPYAAAAGMGYLGLKALSND